MKAMGIVRKMDKLGRIVIPMEFRKYLNITNSSELAMTIVDGEIIIKKIQNKCLLCSNFISRKKNVKNPIFLNKLCDECIKQIVDYKESIKYQR